MGETGWSSGRALYALKSSWSHYIMRMLLAVWVIASICWMIGVGYACVGAWPHLSLDLSPSDAGTLSAYDAAVTWHVLGYGAIALVVPIVVFVVGRFLVNRRA